MQVAGRTLALVVSVVADLPKAAKLALAARALGVEVGMFVMSDAVAALPGARPLVAALVDDGVDLVACAHSAHERGLGEREVGVLLGSQDDHAALVHRADRLVAFT